MKYDAVNAFEDYLYSEDNLSRDAEVELAAIEKAVSAAANSGKKEIDYEMKKMDRLLRDHLIEILEEDGLFTAKPILNTFIHISWDMGAFEWLYHKLKKNVSESIEEFLSNLFI